MLAVPVDEGAGLEVVGLLPAAGLPDIEIAGIDLREGLDGAEGANGAQRIADASRPVDGSLRLRHPRPVGARSLGPRIGMEAGQVVRQVHCDGLRRHLALGEQGVVRFRAAEREEFLRHDGAGVEGRFENVGRHAPLRNIVQDRLEERVGTAPEG